MRPSPSRFQKAFSLVEVITVIAILGIVSAIAIPNLAQIGEGARRGTAENIISALNKATKEFGHSQYDLKTTPVAASGGDELLVLRTLQWRDSKPNGELNLPGPFMRTDWNPVPSDKSNDYRAEWDGASWRLLTPGTSGAGLKIVFDGSDLGTPYVHPNDFAPVKSH